MVKGKQTVEPEFRADAAKIINEIATDKYKELIALRSTKIVLICGDYEERPDGTKGPTLAMIELDKQFKSKKINSFMVNHLDTPLDHNTKEKISLGNADMVILLNGEGTGCIKGICRTDKRKPSAAAKVILSPSNSTNTPVKTG